MLELIRSRIFCPAAWVVKRYGLRLLPELFEHLNPMPYEAAAQMQKD
jgi:hypothetical protein